MKETKPCPTWPDYCVTKTGCVYNRKTGHQLTISSMTILGITRRVVWLWQDGRSRSPQISRLILDAWVGPCPEGMECCHNDGNAMNNVFDNLRWDTHRSNIQDQIDQGTHVSCKRAENNNEDTS